MDRTQDQRVHWHQVSSAERCCLGQGQWSCVLTALCCAAMPMPAACMHALCTPTVLCHPPARVTSPSHLHRYTLNMYRPANTTAPVFSAVLSAAGSTVGSDTTFTQEVQVPAGPYQLEITTANVHGAGDKTALSADFTVGEAAGEWGWRGGGRDTHPNSTQTEAAWPQAGRRREGGREGGTRGCHCSMA